VFSRFSICMHGRWLSLAVLLLLALALPMLGQAQSAQDEPNHAGLIIRHGDGSVVTACVGFSEPSISGLELLQRSGIPFIVQQSGLGGAVCKLDNEGCDYPTEDCFCKRNGPTTVYWAFNRLTANGWVFSPVGASSTRVQPGDINGWAWGTGSVASGAQPPVILFDQVCQLQASTPVPPTSASPTTAPTPSPRPHTPIPPTWTPTPTATPSPTATPPPQSAPAAPTATPVPASRTPTTAPSTPTRTPVPPTTTRQPPTPVPTEQPMEPTDTPLLTEVPEIAQAATSEPPPPSATPLPPSAAPVAPTRAAPPTSMPTSAAQFTSALAETEVVAAPTQAVVSSAVATAEGAGGAAPQPPAESRNQPSNYVTFAVLVLLLISAILAVYSRRVR
jgi:hypothetical protein